MNKLLPISVTLLALTACSLSQADPSKGDCRFERSALNINVPNKNEIAATNKIMNMEGREYVDTLYLNYKNGDVAIIEHKYCSLYNFTVSYISDDAQPVKNISDLFSIVRDQLTNAAIIDASTAKAVNDLEETLKQINPNFSESFGRGTDEPSEKYQWTSYGVDFTPLSPFSGLDSVVSFTMSLNQSHDI